MVIAIACLTLALASLAASYRLSYQINSRQARVIWPFVVLLLVMVGALMAQHPGLDDFKLGATVVVSLLAGIVLGDIRARASAPQPGLAEFSSPLTPVNQSEEQAAELDEMRIRVAAYARAGTLRNLSVFGGEFFAIWGALLGFDFFVPAILLWPPIVGIVAFAVCGYIIGAKAPHYWIGVFTWEKRAAAKSS